MTSLTRRDLDIVGCETPGCDHTSHDGLYLHSNCHPEAPTWVHYSAVSGNLRIECAICDHLIATIAVSSGSVPTLAQDA